MKTGYIALMAGAALLLCSCSEKLQQDSPLTPKRTKDGKIQLLIPAEGLTKTTFDGNYTVKWDDAADAIGIFIGSTSSNVKATITRVEGVAYFSATVDEYQAGDMLYAYYPYSETASGTASSLTLSIPSSQAQTSDGVFNGACNPMVSVPVVLPEVGTALSEPLKFRHTGAMFEFRLKNVPSGETVKEVHFVADGAAGEFAYDLTRVSADGDMPSLQPSGSAAAVVVSLSEASAGASETKVYMTLVPGTYKGNLLVFTDKGIYRYTGITLEGSRAGVEPVEANLSGTVVDSSKEIKSSYEYQLFVAAANAGDYSLWTDSEGEVKLGADISTEGSFTLIRKDWAGVFNGQNHTMTQNGSIAPLFSVITAEGGVKNLVLRGKMTSVAYPDGFGSGSIAMTNYGKISDIDSGIDITIDASDKNYMVCGIVKLNCGTMQNCIQSGDIDVTYKLTANRTTYIGGLSCFTSNTAQYQSSQESLSLGKFIGCSNTGNITARKTGTGSFYTAKFSIGGICAIVHQGIASNYSLFENCSNSGNISRLDNDQTGKNNFSAVGGIIGRVCDANADYMGVSNTSAGFYIVIKGCSNTGTIENSSYLLNGWTGPNVSGARMGVAGGIVGYIRGLSDKYAEITDCSSTGIIRGGHTKSSNILGGIAGMCSYTAISNPTVDMAFNDSSLSDITLLTGAVGGIVGYIRNDSTITGGSVDAEISMPNTTVSACGICTAGVSTMESTISATISGVKLCGSIAHKGLSETVAITSENIGTYASSFGGCTLENLTYWTK